MIDEFQQTARKIYEDARKDGRLTHNPSRDLLRNLALEEPGVKETRYGNIMANSEPTSRAAMFTKNNIDTPFGKGEHALLDQATEHLRKEHLISVDVVVGDGSEGITARLITPKRFAHLAYGGMKLFKPTSVERPTHQVIIFFDKEYEENSSKTLPQKSITIRNAHSREGCLTKIVRNSNYTGEWKKAIFAGENYRAKQKSDAIFLHAGCRHDYLEMSHGGCETRCSLFVALSANGKTSLTCKVLARKTEEKSWLIQDDGGILRREGSFGGFEAGGLFVKTDGLNPHNQIETYYGTLKSDTFLENVYVDENGEIDFYNIERTSNGRAIIERRDFMHASRDINVERIDNLFIITRGSIIPAIAKLTPQEATAFMVLGQSMESSAGDPTQAGKIKNEFFYDPFVAGDKADHANLFYDILTDNPHVNCYLLNTGGIGEGAHYHDIRLEDTVGILDAVIRGGLEDWIESEATGLLVPKSVRLVDSILMHPERLFSSSEFGVRQRELDRQRAERLEQYGGLHKDIRTVFQK